MVGRKMRIIIAENIGFCFGVERAYKISLDALNKGNCQMLGHLVHNEKVVEELESKGLRFVPAVDNLKEGRVIIRAHGVGDETIKALKSRNMEIIDATCPLVRKAQNFARTLNEEGKILVIIGEKGHAEIEAINGSADNRAVIIENEEDINDIPEGLPLGVVIQTTKDSKLAEDLTNSIKSRFNDVTVCDTLCHAVLKRQEEVKKLAEEAEIILVVGSKTSANTQTLVKVSQRNRMTYGVEGPEDLKKEWFDGVGSVGIISGTSTPYRIIELVEERVKSVTS